MQIQGKNRSRGFGLFLLLIGGVALLLALAIFLSWSSISGSEFSPNTFQERTFTYSRVPGTMFRLASTQLSPAIPAAPTDVLKHLPTLQQAAVWHVTELSGVRGEVHSAKILLESLKQKNANGASFWGAWSIDHPDLAGLLWPFVQQVALQNLYFCIPELLSRSENATNPKELEQVSFQVLADAVNQRCDFWKVEGNDAARDELIQWFSTLPIQSSDETTKRSIQGLRDKVLRQNR